MLIAQIIVSTLGFYLLLGVIFAFYFVFSKIEDVDEAAKGTGIGFKVLIFFGVVAFWPLLARRVWGQRIEPVERNSHRDSAIPKNS